MKNISYVVVNNNDMSKIRKKTGQVCLVCDEKLCDAMSVTLHKTRRQNHGMCLDCAQGYITPIIAVITNNLRQNIRKDVQHIQCPGGYHGVARNRCKHKFDVTKLQFPPECPIYTDLVRISFVLSSDMAFVCPDEKCGGVVEVAHNYTNIKLRCPHCLKEWCRQCLVTPYHDNQSCIEYEIEHNNSENGQYILKMSKAGLLKFCPKCRAPIVKSSGCNKMYCSKCMCKWCWLCGDTNIDYSHFNKNKGGGCADKLWEGTQQGVVNVPEDLVNDFHNPHGHVGGPVRPPIRNNPPGGLAIGGRPIEEFQDWAGPPAAW